MNKLILIAAISFGLGGITGGIVVHLHEGPRPLNAFEQMMLEEKRQSEQTKQDLQKALRSSPAFPGGMSEGMKKAK
jgi:hypothetical protein